MSGSITSANATYMLAVEGVYPIPQQLQGFSTDDIFGTDPVAAAEVSMGVDGRMSAGFIYVPFPQAIILQADSESNDIFDDWYAAQQTNRELFRASGLILLPALERKWTLINGVLSTYPPLPDAKKILQPRRFAITWEKISPAAV